MAVRSGTAAADAPELILFALHGNAGAQSPSSRVFPCKFCRREFRSAQALGGHMNVHRHERNLAKDLVHLRHHPGDEPVPARTQDLILEMSKMQETVGDPSSSSSSSEPLPPPVSTPVTAGGGIDGGPDSEGRGLDLQLRLGSAAGD